MSLLKALDQVPRAEELNFETEKVQMNSQAVEFN